MTVDKLLFVLLSPKDVHIEEELVAQMSEEDLEILNGSGMTAMALALGDTKMLEFMHKKNKKLLTICDPKNRIPLLVALEVGNIEAAHHLYPVTPKEDLIQDAKDHSDSSLITALILWNKLGKDL
ncbi:hypothetical protein CJ030_MR8G004986 [Morella rubra]|uniref:Uncharacterized protein n=1 Tax=Morella rubra TaxID=262757 RepID=A0A6A1UPT6_9ROSI|nr:hypothetical protein CJ030_MR8G004986 [Morella rubra]